MDWYELLTPLVFVPVVGFLVFVGCGIDTRGLGLGSTTVDVAFTVVFDPALPGAAPPFDVTLQVAPPPAPPDFGATGSALLLTFTEPETDSTGRLVYKASTPFPSASDPIYELRCGVSHQGGQVYIAEHVCTYERPYENQSVRFAASNGSDQFDNVYC